MSALSDKQDQLFIAAASIDLLERKIDAEDSSPQQRQRGGERRSYTELQRTVE
jgi:hypothetical protein